MSIWLNLALLIPACFLTFRPALRPFMQGHERVEKLDAFRRQPIRSLLVLSHHSCFPKLQQTESEYAWRDVITASPKLSEAQALFAQLPDDAQYPTLSQQIKHSHNGPASLRSSDWFAWFWPCHRSTPCLLVLCMIY